MASARDALWQTGYDESVEVNQRALIDKVLARYSGEFTVFRELLQNSDDASATSVEIHFQTKGYLDRQSPHSRSSDGYTLYDEPSLPDLKTTMVHQWTFKNNGIVFRNEDWSRLKKIAEGNPDEEKIGAFGVGFYSLFSVTDEPWVFSGGQWMNFYWKDKKDQLFARRGARKDSEDDPWTSFQMELRESTPIPPPFDFTRFLASSITFMRHLLEVSVYLDDKRLSRLTKAPGIPKALTLPKDLKASSPLNMMVVNGIETTPLSIKAEVMQWVYMAGTEKPQPKKQLPQPATGGAGFFSSLFSSLAGSGVPSRTATPLPAPTPVPKVDPKAIVESNVVLSIFAADVLVKLDKKMVAELHRSTKKNPPTRMKYEMIYTGKSEYDASKSEDEKQGRTTGSVFQGLRADIEGTGMAKVFIGHSTAQTTGLGGHMAARFIPTVERESIDLVDRNVAIWNKELLYIGGFLARAAYEIEMGHIRQLWDEALKAARAAGPDKTVDPEFQATLRGRAIHALKFFTYNPSTPSAVVSAAQEEAFFACASSTSLLGGAKSHFPIMSTVGVRDASGVRYPDATFSGFIKDLAVVPDEIMKQAKTMVDTLRARSMIKDITFVDVRQELRDRPLTETEMIACFKWWIGVCTQGSTHNVEYFRTQLLEAAVLSFDEKDETAARHIPLSAIESFLNSRSTGALIPTDGPLPLYLLPVTISRHFDPQSLVVAFGWREFVVVDWLRHIVDPPAPHDTEHDLHLSAQWAERVLQVLARASQSLPRPQQDEVATMLKDHACIPTSSGLKKPEDAYFQNAHIFHDLPVVTLPSGAVVKGPLEKFLVNIGVRKHVDLQIVFNRMIKTGDWTIAELIKYLVAVQSTLTPTELDRLMMTSAFPREHRDDEKVENSKLPRCKASDLYEPLDVFRELGLPVIGWGTHPKWRSNSEEAKFLFKLGLRRYPSLAELIGLAASNDVGVRAAALKYFFENYTTRYTDYDPDAFSNVAFIPAVKGSTRVLAKPHEVFSSPEWAALGFMVVDSVVLRGDALMHLKIQEHPPGFQLVALFESSPPPTEDIARQWFTTLASRIVAFSPADLRRLADIPFVPVTATPGTIRHLPPTQCYFKGDSQAQYHSKLFTFVDFGTTANTFLNACGVKHEPSVEEIAKILLNDPRRFYQLAEGRENYLTELRSISVNRRLISSGTMYRLKKAPVLLGSRRVKKNNAVALGKKPLDDASGDLEEEDWEYQYDLLTPDKILIADETNAYQLFGDQIFTAPQEDLLEDFYLELGCKRLSIMVREDYHTSPGAIGWLKGVETRALILERLPLFLHEHTHTKTKVSYSWLNSGKNFIVKTFGKLTVTKTLQFAEKKVSRSQDASAVARRIGRGPIELWLAGNDQVDMYEVSTSMCRLLFDSPKVNDALLFMTILSTDLRALRRRGYNVDRILRQQKADKLAAEEAARTELNSLASLAAFAHLSGASSSPDTLVSAPPVAEMTNGAPPLPGMEPMMEHVSDRSSKYGISTMLNRIKKRAKGDDTASIAGPRDDMASIAGPRDDVGSPPKDHADARPDSDPQMPLLPKNWSDRPRTPKPHATPRSMIASNIDLAIKACKEEHGETLKNRQQMHMVKESLNEGYCDISGYPTDMTLVGDMDGIKIFATKDVPDVRSLMQTKNKSLARFIYTIRPLQEVYTLPPTSVHVFYDRAGELIAFNRNASLFLNLRYFEEWHDAEVERGELLNAYTSWYFTLAHEIAHNLTRVHNAEHEFYFSSICEAYMPAFTRLVAGK